MALDKLSKIGKEGVINELQSKGFSNDAIMRLQPFLSLKGTFETQLSDIAQALEGIEIAQEGIEELKFIFGQLNRQSLKAVSLSFDVIMSCFALS